MCGESKCRFHELLLKPLENIESNLLSIITQFQTRREENLFHSNSNHLSRFEIRTIKTKDPAWWGWLACQLLPVSNLKQRELLANPFDVEEEKKNKFFIHTKQKKKQKLKIHSQFAESNITAKIITITVTIQCYYKWWFEAKNWSNEYEKILAIAQYWNLKTHVQFFAVVHIAGGCLIAIWFCELSDWEAKKIMQ